MFPHEEQYNSSEGKMIMVSSNTNVIFYPKSTADCQSEQMLLTDQSSKPARSFYERYQLPYPALELSLKPARIVYLVPAVWLSQSQRNCLTVSLSSPQLVTLIMHQPSTGFRYRQYFRREYTRESWKTVRLDCTVCFRKKTIPTPQTIFHSSVKNAVS